MEYLDEKEFFNHFANIFLQNWMETDFPSPFYSQNSFLPRVFKQNQT